MSTLDGFYRYLDSITMQSEEPVSDTQTESEDKTAILGSFELGHATTLIFDKLERAWEDNVEYRFQMWKLKAQQKDDLETFFAHRDSQIVNMIKAQFRFSARRVTRYFYKWKRKPMQIVSNLPIILKKGQMRRKNWGLRKLHLVISNFRAKLAPTFAKLSFFIRRRLQRFFTTWSQAYHTFSKSATIGAQFTVLRFKTFQTQSLILLSGIHKKALRIKLMKALRQWRQKVKQSKDVGIVNQQKVSQLVHSSIKKLENDMRIHEDALVQGRLKSLIFEMCIQVLNEM